MSTPIIEETFDEENDNIIKTVQPDNVGDVSTIQNTTFENMEKTFSSEIHHAKHETSPEGADQTQETWKSPAIGKMISLKCCYKNNEKINLLLFLKQKFRETKTP